MDINKRDIATAVIVDKQDDTYSIFAEMANITGAGNKGKASGVSGVAQSFSVVKGSGKVISAARLELESKLDKPLFIGSVRALVFTERIVYSGLEEYANRLREDEQFRKNILLAVTNVKPEELLSGETENGVSIGSAIEDTFRTLADSKQAYDVTTADVLEWLSAKKCFVLPCIGLENNDVTLKGYYIFCEGKCIGFIPYTESRGLICFLTNQTKFIYEIPFGDNKSTAEIENIKRKITPHYSNGKISFDLDFEYSASLLYFEKNIKFDETVKTDLNAEIEKMIFYELSKTVYTSQTTFKSDYLRFDTAFRISYPEEFKQMDWLKEYPNAEFRLNVKIKLSESKMMDYNPPVEK